MASLQMEMEEDDILTFEVSDEALESAGAASDSNKFTWGVCTLDQSGCPA